ncbi:MAG TPA: peptidylprolyl isomerase [Ktedonosporobacter sp.]|nr:peptidylprolyl isomerase [Ktedonosporobacter sp.]
MTSQTARRPENKQSTRSAKNKKYVKQTAHVEARRDGKPLIFGWGGHLSYSEKTRLQRRIVWTASIAIAVLIVTVIVGTWVNINVIVPNLPITSVNGQPVPQSDFRKLVALKAQIEANKLHGLQDQRDTLKKQVDSLQRTLDDTQKAIDGLNAKIKALPAGTSAQRTDLENQLKTAQTKLTDTQKTHDDTNAKYQDMLTNVIPNEQQLYTQPQQSSESVDWLQDDLLIRGDLAKDSAAQAKVEPSASAVDKALHDFAAAIPHPLTYNTFLSNNNVSDADMHTMMALKLRRDNMQNYLASQITSPSYQVLARAMTLSTQSDADAVLKQLKKNIGDFAKLAKQKSVDTASNAKGGDLGWLVKGQYSKDYAANASGGIDNWLFDPHRTLNELSSVIAENGTFHIIQIMQVDPSRAIDDATLKDLKSNALQAWLLSQKALPGVKVGPADTDKQTAPENMPPGLPASAPAQATPGAAPGGVPSGDVPSKSALG